MNDRHPSGYPAYDSYGQQHSASGYPEYDDGDPLFGSLPGSYDTGRYDAVGHDTGTYEAAATGTYETGTYDTSAYGTAAYDTGAYGTVSYDTGTYNGGAYSPSAYDTGTYETGQYDTTGCDTGTYDALGYATGSYATTGAYTPDGHGTGGYETGVPDGYDPYAHTAYENAGHEPYPQHDQHDQRYPEYEQHEQYAQHPQYEQPAYGTGTYSADGYGTGSYATGGYDAAGHDAPGHDTADHATSSFEATAIWSTTDRDLIADIPTQAGPTPYESVQFEAEIPAPAQAPDDAHQPVPDALDAASVADAMTQAMPVTAAAPAARRVAGPAPGKAVRGRGRRRTAKRSALLTVAVPSVAAMGVCAAAAASVTGFVGDDKKDEKPAQAAGDPGSVKASAANAKLDTQLAGLSADARDFGDRANRTQERIDLKERQALAKQRAEEEAARKEALRPKFVLPVTQHGLSALFGQAGVNWMSVHTGIDFPVSYGTPVMAATDGTVRTQWNSAYGNMAIVTAPDGTETWYCHLSSTKIRSGSVKAGEQIAYSGNSGNSTGPHLHFEVRPGGDSAIDPIPWLHSHGLNPD
ncbi:peptidoglycan DD-metalloendopeptidase family protein [Streptomyces sp. NPDC101150]|uniref:M23 family metallopeptidase n=1 Tax=Streptomyces sp. NPDC101150 TaxID=3366114 RepID=UPI0037FA901E